MDVVLVGGGIMSATLGIWLRELEPSWSMMMIERLAGVAKESSNGWNNAGTGHSALAELNYTPERDGRIDIAKAVEINEAFQLSRQFWAWGIKQGALKNPRSFINHAPHMSFVYGDDNVRFLRKRYEALQTSPLFRGMQYSEDHEQIRRWAPLMMEGRDAEQHVAATWTPLGTDMNFGEIARQFVGHLQEQPGFDLELSSEVRGIARNADGSWRITYAETRTGRNRRTVDAKFVFIGAGGGALRLLQMSGIPEAGDYGAFPVGGSFLVTDKPDVVARHLAKAYGKAPVGSPPMSVPHLDTRVLGGKKALLFGPFATFSTKFLKEGSYLDLLGSTNVHNVVPMLRVGWRERSLIEYLASQLMLSDDDRFHELQQYFPLARKEDWRLWQAGQRVQVIKRDSAKGGVLKLGTEIVSAADGSIAGLLGASPGASTAAHIMLQLLERVFKERFASAAWQDKLHRIIPSYGSRLNDDPRLVAQELAYTCEVLELPPPPHIPQTPVARAAAVAANVEPMAPSAMRDMAL